MEKRLYRKTRETFLANSVNTLVLLVWISKHSLFTDRGTEISTPAFFNELGNREIIVATYKVASAKMVV